MKRLSEEQKKELRSLPKDEFVKRFRELNSEDGFETENLELKSFTAKTARDFYKKVIVDQEAIRYSSSSYLDEIKSFEDWLVRVDGYINMKILTEKATGRAVGCLKIENDYDNQAVSCVDISWLTARDFNDTDRLAEAIKAVARDIFENQSFFESQYDLIEIRVNEKQPHAEEICRKAGFTKEGVLRNRCIDRITGEKCNCEVWSFLREELNKS